MHGVEWSGGRGGVVLKVGGWGVGVEIGGSSSHFFSILTDCFARYFVCKILFFLLCIFF